MEWTFFNSENHIYPLSIQQMQLWYAFKTIPRVPLWHLYDTIRLTGIINIAALRNAVSKLINFNKLLNYNVIVRDKVLVQYVPAQKCIKDCFIEYNCSCFVESERKSKAKDRISKFLTEYIQIEDGQLFKVLLIKMGKEDYILSLKVHHIICDMSSLFIIWNDLSHFYNILLQDYKIPKPKNRRQYHEYVSTQNKKNTLELMHERKKYWENQLQNKPTELNIPTDYPRLHHQIYHSSYQQFIISAKLTKEIKDYATINKISSFSIFVSALYLLLYLYTHQFDIVIGTSFLGRDRDFGFTDTIGLFINMIALRLHISEQWTIHELINNVNKKMMSGHKNQDYPVLSLLSKIKSSDMSDGVQLFRVTIDKLLPNKNKMLGGKVFVPSDFDHLKQKRCFSVETDTSSVELSYEIYESDRKTSVFINYWTMLYKKETISRMGEHYNYIIQLILKNSSNKIGSTVHNFSQTIRGFR